MIYEKNCNIYVILSTLCITILNVKFRNNVQHSSKELLTASQKLMRDLNNSPQTQAVNYELLLFCFFLIFF